MKQKNDRWIWIKLAVLLLIAALIKLFSVFGSVVENVYSAHIYPGIAITLRTITGWLPFSLGDVLYAAVTLWLVVKLILLIRVMVKGQASWKGFFYGIGKTLVRLVWVYIIFNVFWGLNYDRYGISYQLNLNEGQYSTDELKQLTSDLLERVNTARKAVGDSSFVYPPNAQMFLEAGDAYASAANKFPFLAYKSHSVKKSLYGKLDNMFGFLGYYNPFSGEAQVNTVVPPFLIPFTTCHEIGHQLGYGSESEANFVGYLSATSSKYAIFQYSAYFDMFNYANGELFERDTAAARSNYRALDTLVKKDFRIYREFLRAQRNPVEPVIRMFYGEYLKANRQPQGINTYNEVVAWLIAYKKKNGHI